MQEFKQRDCLSGPEARALHDIHQMYLVGNENFQEARGIPPKWHDFAWLQYSLDQAVLCNDVAELLWYIFVISCGISRYSMYTMRKHGVLRCTG
jgi:hypothetical protein